MTKLSLAGDTNLDGGTPAGFWMPKVATLYGFPPDNLKLPLRRRHPLNIHMYVHVPNSYTYMHNIHFYHINVCMYIICIRGYGPGLKDEDWHVKSFHTPVLAQRRKCSL